MTVLNDERTRALALACASASACAFAIANHRAIRRAIAAVFVVRQWCDARATGWENDEALDE